MDEGEAIQNLCKEGIPEDKVRPAFQEKHRNYLLGILIRRYCGSLRSRKRCYGVVKKLGKDAYETFLNDVYQMDIELVYGRNGRKR